MADTSVRKVVKMKHYNETGVTAFWKSAP